MKIFLITFGVVFVLGAVIGISVMRHSADASSNDVQRAIASMPTPTGGDSSLNSPPDSTDFNARGKHIETEDEKNAREQNWKADHIKPAGPGDSNVTDEDRRELDDTEAPHVQPVNRPK